MRKTIFTLVVLLCNSLFQVYAQSNLFTTQYVEAGETSDEVTHLATLDGGMIITSIQHPDTAATYYITIVKTDVSGTVQWTKKFATARPGFRNILQSADGTYFLCYCEFPFGHYYEALRLDQNGNVLFDKKINLPPACRDNWKVATLARSDSGYYVACSITDTTNSMIHWNLFSMSASGNILWTKNYNSDVFLGPLVGLELCNNGDILLLGSSYNLTSQSYSGVATRVSSNGNFLWTKRITNAGHDLYLIDAEKQGSNFILSVQDYDQNVGLAAVEFMKMDSTGSFIWEIRYTGGNNSLLPYDLISMGNNEYAMVAMQSGPQLGSVFLKVDASGQYVSSRFYSRYTFTSIEPVNAWQYSLAGTHDSLNEHYITLKTVDVDGNGCDDTTAVFGFGPVFYPVTSGGTVNNFSLSAIPGNLQMVNAVIVPYDRCIITGVIESPTTSGIEVYPSPASGWIHVASTENISRIELTDLNGKVVRSANPGAAFYDLPVDDLPSSIYLLRIINEADVITRKVIISH